MQTHTQALPVAPPQLRRATAPKRGPNHEIIGFRSIAAALLRGQTRERKPV
jgi:hypothetical protein